MHRNTLQNAHVYRVFLLSTALHATQRLDLGIISTTWPWGCRRRCMPIPVVKYPRLHLLGTLYASHITGTGDAADNGIVASGAICSTSRSTSSSRP
jgi:hypothetical protein